MSRTGMSPEGRWNYGGTDDTYDCKNSIGIHSFGSADLYYLRGDMGREGDYQVGTEGEEKEKMSILIKGMEMPRFCGECTFYTGIACGAKRYGDIYGTYIKNAHKIPDWCPLVEVPKHGRLIDADEFEKYVELEYETREISHPNWIKFRVWCGDQPTIIEAEESDG